MAGQAGALIDKDPEARRIVERLRSLADRLGFEENDLHRRLAEALEANSQGNYSRSTEELITESEINRVSVERRAIEELELRLRRVRADAFLGQLRWHDAVRECREIRSIAKAPSDADYMREGLAAMSAGMMSEGPLIGRLLSEAVTAYRSALEVRTREDLPQDWASTQNNLGAALSLLIGICFSSILREWAFRGVESMKQAPKPFIKSRF